MRVPVAYRVDWNRRGSPTHVVSTAKDWSRGGLFIRTTQARAPGEVISLRLDIGDGVICCQGTVVHRCPQGMGIAIDVTEARVV